MVLVAVTVSVSVPRMSPALYIISLYPGSPRIGVAIRLGVLTSSAGPSCLKHISRRLASLFYI
jgi:hypothetical protein